MWFFGHLGLGTKLVSPLSRKLPLSWILFGTLLPDLIDKPLFYGLKALGDGVPSNWISCTRTFGHNSLVLFTLLVLATLKKSPVLAALSLGVASHLALDGFQDYWFLRVEKREGESSLLLALLYPFFENRFGTMPFKNLEEHLSNIRHPLLWGGEMVGLGLLGWEIWKRRWSPRPSALRSGWPWRKSKAARSTYGSDSYKKRADSFRT